MIRLREQIVDFSTIPVMGIVNVTPDSFAVHCARLDEESVLAECERLLCEGADILDVGTCSTRPGSEPVDENEECRRLDMALRAIRQRYPQCLISVDTFRANIARHVVENYQVDIINDVSGLADPAMLDVLSRVRVPYVLTYPGAETKDALAFFANKLDILHQARVSDVILDPGLGFGKTLEQNYALLHQIPLWHQLGAPVLIGLSRKSMLYRPLGITPHQALNATTAAHMLALVQGADILRVHDVKAAKEAIRIKELGIRI